jgi:hypothetical protein
VAHRGRNSANDVLTAQLAAGATVRDAATAAGVSERTVFRRLEDTAFTARLKALRAAMVSTAAGKLAGGMSDAAASLVEASTRGEMRTRLRAAELVLTLGMKVTELSDLEARVAEVERRLKAKERGVMR